jgi:hypothetical protein
MMCEFKPPSWQGVLDSIFCDKVCQLPATDQWFFPGTLVSSTNKTDHHDITEILLKVALNTITLTLNFLYPWQPFVKQNIIVLFVITVRELKKKL